MNSGIRARIERLAYPLRLAFDCTTKAFWAQRISGFCSTAELKVYPVRRPDAAKPGSNQRGGKPRPTKKKGQGNAMTADPYKVLGVRERRLLGRSSKPFVASLASITRIAKRRQKKAAEEMFRRCLSPMTS